MPGEIGTLFVRIRPDISGFSAEAKVQVDKAMGTLKGAISQTATANAAASEKIRSSVDSIAKSYQEIGVAATEGTAKAREAVSASITDLRAQAAAAGRSSVSDAERSVQANRLLIESYHNIGKAAVAGSDEAVLAFRKEAEATARLNAELGIVEKKSGGIFGALKRHFLNLSTAFGVGFGADLGIRFVKNMVGAAASAEKSTEVIRSEFGRTGKEILDFANKAGIGLGLTSEKTLATAARLGILFKNVGLAGPITTRMTLGFLKLAGSLASIRGINADQALSALTTAAAGNLRGLKQLGIVVDENSIKVAAFKLGLISTVKGAITPAIRAQAVYALATANLGTFLAQAKKHSGDYADTQARLSAEWAHSKEIIGKALLPSFDRLSGRLANWLDKLNRSGRLQKDVNKILRTAGGIISGVFSVLGPLVSTFHHFVDAIGGAKNAVKGFLTVFAVGKFLSIASAIKTTLIKQGILAIGPAAIAAQGEAGVAFAGIGFSAEALSATLKSALISTGIGALVVALGIAVTLIIDHWSKVKKWLGEFYAWLKRQHAWQEVVKVVMKAVADVRRVVSALVGWFGPFWKHWGDTITAITKTVWGAIKSSIASFLGIIEGTVEVFKGVFEGKWSEIWKGVKKIVSSGLKELLVPFRLFARLTVEVFDGLWKTIELGALKGIRKVLELIAKVPTSFKIFGVKIGGTNPAKAALASVDADIAALQRARARVKALAQAPGESGAKFGGGALGSDKANAARSAAAAGDVQGFLSTLLGPLNAIRASVALAIKAHKEQLAALKKVEAQDAAANAIFNDSVREAIRSAKQRLADAIATGNEKIKAARDSFNTFMHQGNAAVVSRIKTDNAAIVAAQNAFHRYVIEGNAAVVTKIKNDNRTIAGLAKSAAENVTAIGNKIQAAIGEIVKKNQAGAFSGNSKEFAQLRALIASGRSSAEVLNRANRLAGELQNGQSSALSVIATKLKNQAGAIVLAANRGKVSPTKARAELEALVKQAGGSKVLGAQGAATLLADLRGFQKQLQIIAAEPKSVRDAARRSTQGGLGPKIINVVAEIKRLRTQETADATKYGRGLQDRLAHLKAEVERLRTSELNAATRYAEGLKTRLSHLTATQDAVAKSIGRAHDNLARTEHRQTLRVAEHSLIEHRKHTKALNKIEAAAAKSLALQKQVASTKINPQFKTAVAENPGVTAHSARVAGAKGLKG